MKNFLCISTICLLSAYSVTNAQWVQTNTQPSRYVLSFWKTDTSLIAGEVSGIYNSTDNGITWTELLPWAQLEFVNAFVAAPTESAGTNLFAGGLGGIYLSTNGGTSWIAANSGLENKQVRSLAVISGETEGTITLFAGTTTGVFRSSDNGTSWIASGLDSSDVFALTVTKDETGRSIILAGIQPAVGISSCIFRSTDKGLSWTASSLFTYNTTCFAMSSVETGETNIFAGTYSGIYLSSDSGINWIHLSAGLQWSVRSIAIIPNGAGGINIFAGTFMGGIFLSTDNGESWSTINTGLTYEDKSIDALVASGDYIFAAINIPSGVWKRPISEMITSVESTSEVLPAQFILEQNYPNPFNPSTKISWQSPISSWQTLKIYDVLGEEVATLVDEYKPAGSYEVEFDGSQLSSGIYFYKLHAADPLLSSRHGFVKTGKMILLK